MCELSLRQDLLNPIINWLQYLGKPNDSRWKRLNWSMLEAAKIKASLSRRGSAWNHDSSWMRIGKLKGTQIKVQKYKRK